MFQHTAARRRLAAYLCSPNYELTFQHTAARRRLAVQAHARSINGLVSTHSRPKAAGRAAITRQAVMREFQHTAARRRLVDVIQAVWQVITVSTHSRPKAAGLSNYSGIMDK